MMWEMLQRLQALYRELAGRFERRKFPWLLLASALVLTTVGALFIVSAHSAALARRHLLFASLGLFAFIAVALFDYRHLRSVVLPLYLAAILSLVLLFVFGIEANNARRWYDLRLFHLQPSELVKYVMVIVLADYFCYRRHRDRFSDLFPALVLTVLPMGLIAAQPDLGSALLFAPLFAGMAFMAGVPVRKLFLLALAGVILITAAWFMPKYGLKEYQKQRLITFIDPERNPDSAASYNIRQVTRAIAAGGLRGEGWGRGALNRLGHIPESHTDFIFPVIAEEWGLFRTALLILTFLLTMGLMAKIMLETRDPFGRLIVGGVLTIFAVQTLLHMAISLRMAPITGLTLPLVSYGGSSLVTTYAGLGMVASVALRKSFDFGAAGEE